MVDTKIKTDNKSKIEELLKQKQRKQFNNINTNLNFKSARPNSSFRTQNRGGK